MSVLDFLKDNAFTTAVVGIVTAGLTYLGIRTQKAPTVVDTQAALDAAVSAVLTHYRTTLAETETGMASLRAEVAELRRQVDDYADKLDIAERKIDEQEQHISELTDMMTKSGLTPPARRRHGWPQNA
jgi:septal ring factor EnvC (AmiA/AmiB activator)